ACAGSTFTPQASCDGQGTCITPPPVTCKPYVCKDAQSCWGSCTGAAQCLAPASCLANSCGTKDNGAGCAAGTECTSAHCVQNVCCDGGCPSAGVCQTCVGPGNVGKCTSVADGTPCGQPKACASGGLSAIPA